MTPGATNDAIELRVDEIAQLFHTLDPFPFRDATSTAKRRNLSSVGRVNWPPISPSELSFRSQKATFKARLRKIWEKHSEGIFPTGRPYYKVTSLSSSGLVDARWASAWSC